MGTFATKKILQGNPSLIPVIAEQIKTEFAAEQFEVQIDNLLSGGVDISISNKIRRSLTHQKKPDHRRGKLRLSI